MPPAWDCRPPMTPLNALATEPSVLCSEVAILPRKLPAEEANGPRRPETLPMIPLSAPDAPPMSPEIAPEIPLTAPEIALLIPLTAPDIALPMLPSENASAGLASMNITPDANVMTRKRFMSFKNIGFRKILIMVLLSLSAKSAFSVNIFDLINIKKNKNKMKKNIFKRKLTEIKKI